jgi:hypothetical protein
MGIPLSKDSLQHRLTKMLNAMSLEPAKQRNSDTYLGILLTAENIENKISPPGSLRGFNCCRIRSQGGVVDRRQLSVFLLRSPRENQSSSWLLSITSIHTMSKYSKISRSVTAGKGTYPEPLVEHVFISVHVQRMLGCNA